MEIRILKRQGVGVREIARRTGLSRNTVKRYLGSTEDPVYTARPVVAGKLDAHKVFLSERVIAAQPDRIPATVLLSELRLRGYTGGITNLRLVTSKRLISTSRSVFFSRETQIATL